ncbi:glucose 1-dehydrogenase [Paenibacillus motobuensis]|uniref:Glucose 1-dehydrogenase n=1 Tax=Paenibacillus motobuensis TaxID=295324 RepID=A0ABN0YCC4_9BACL
MGKLDGKVVIVTGASGGQGQLHARTLASEGAKVVLTDLVEEGGKQVAEEIGDNAIFVKHNIASESEWNNVVNKAEEAFGPVTVLINNAGIAGSAVGKLTGDIPLEEFEQVMNVNATGTFLGMKAVIPSMKKAGGGSIVNISSIGGQFASKGAMAYHTSKFAVTGMTKAAALDYAQDNIRVNSVHPGTIESPALEAAGAEETVKKIKEKTPLRRLGKPEEAAKLVLFLASDDSSFSTGAEFVIDGGVTAEA